MTIADIRRITRAAVAGIAAVHLALEAAKELDNENPDTAGMLASVAVTALDQAETAMTNRAPVKQKGRAFGEACTIEQIDASKIAEQLDKMMRKGMDRP